MVAAARHEGVSPAPVVFEQHQRVLDALTSTEDVQIDQAYISAQVAAHEEAIALFEGYLLHGAEGAMKTFAGETLPVVQQHQTLTAAFLETQHGAAL